MAKSAIKNTAIDSHRFFLKQKKNWIGLIRETITVILCFSVMLINLTGPYFFPATIIIICLALAPFNLISRVDGAARFVFTVIISYVILLTCALNTPDLANTMADPNHWTHWLLFILINFISAVRVIECWGWPLHRYFQHLGFFTKDIWLFRYAQCAHQCHHRLQDSISNYFRDTAEHSTSREEVKVLFELVEKDGEISAELAAEKKTKPSIFRSIGGYPDSISLSWFGPSLLFIVPHIFIHLYFINKPSTPIYLGVFYFFLLSYAVIGADYAHRAQHHYSMHWWDNRPILHVIFSPFFHWTKILHLAHHNDEQNVCFSIANPALDVIAGTMADQTKAIAMYNTIRDSQLGGELYLEISTLFAADDGKDLPDEKLMQIGAKISELAEAKKQHKLFCKLERDKIIELSNTRMQVKFFDTVPDLAWQIYLWQTKKMPNMTVKYVSNFINVIDTILAEKTSLLLTETDIKRYEYQKSQATNLLNAANLLKSQNTILKNINTTYDNLKKHVRLFYYQLGDHERQLSNLIHKFKLLTIPKSKLFPTDSDLSKLSQKAIDIIEEMASHPQKYLFDEKLQKGLQQKKDFFSKYIVNNR